MVAAAGAEAKKKKQELYGWLIFSLRFIRIHIHTNPYGERAS
jgi:hypothetical protein